MYERSAIVLERYFENIFGLNKANNLKTNYKNYEQIVKVIKNYKDATDEEEKVISKFDESAAEIESIQSKQSKLHKSNLELEEQRNKLFNDLEEDPNILDSKFQKIEEKVTSNNEEIKALRSSYVKAMVLFIERQKERNKYARIRRTVESEYMNKINEANKMFELIDKMDIKKVQDFMKIEDEKIKQTVFLTMTKNGKNEKIPFSVNVFEKAIKARIKIAKQEAELYINIYGRTKKILEEIEKENIKLIRAEKLVKDTGVKLVFLNAEKEYIVNFLDNERMTSINGKKTHEKLMEEACKNFDDDIEQINNLYELLLREITNRSTKKAYEELYNKDYLRKIEEKEKDFEKEVTNVKVNIGTVINSNYWRIEGIKNIYKVFKDEVTEKFNKDLSEYEVIEEEKTEDILSDSNKILKRTINNNYDDDIDDEDLENIEEDDDYNDIEEDEYDYDDIEEDDYDDSEDEYDYDDIEEDDYDDSEEDEYYYDDIEEDDYDDIEDNHDNDIENDYDKKIKKYYDGYDKNIYGINIEEDKEYLKKQNDVDDELTEESIEELIENSRKRRKRNKISKYTEYEEPKGLIGKLFKK